MPLRLVPGTALLAVAAVLALAVPADAHGIGEDAADRSVIGFIPVGIEHMLLGWDHLLFILGVVLVARDAKLAAKLITVFVLGHSTTLITATLIGWRVDAGLVDTVIALSVAFVAGVGIIGRPKDFRPFGLAVLGFGLIHGLGLATRFQDLEIPEGGELLRVIAFNVGIEIGQLGAIAVMAAAALLALRFIEPGNVPRVAQLACAPIFIGGSVAASLVALHAFQTGPEAPPLELAEDSTCEITTPTRPLEATGGGHPDQAFFGPKDQTPIADFGHSMGDGYVLVLYPDDITAGQLADLRQFVASPEGQGVLAGPAGPGEELRVLNRRDTMTCQQVELDSISAFSQNWLVPLRG